ncbi:hypothetical protein Tco_0668060 [Tanacetum coccineum]
MVDYSQKWHDGTSSRNISSSSNTKGLAAIVSKLDKLGHMKKLKENVHAIQVGCQICEGPHLDKEFDFVILDMIEYFRMPVILGRPLLSSAMRKFGEVSETTRDKNLRDHWRKRFENEYDDSKKWTIKILMDRKSKENANLEQSNNNSIMIMGSRKRNEDDDI